MDDQWQKQEEQRREQERKDASYNLGAMTGFSDGTAEGTRGADHKKRMDQIYEDYLAPKKPKKPSGPGFLSSAKPVVFFFGFIGLMFGAGFGISNGSGALLGGFLGFVTGGFLGGLLSQFKVGRIILWIVAAAFFAGMAYEIFFKG